VDLLRDPMLTTVVWRGVLVAAAYVAVLVSLAWARFTTKDVTA
jgi:ABC-type transport system involved in multi-copper enzyme maturation permease subunit